MPPQVPTRDLAYQPFATFLVSITRTRSAIVIRMFLVNTLSVQISLAEPVPSREAYLLGRGPAALGSREVN